MRRLIWLQTATEFWVGGGTISLLLNIQGVQYRNGCEGQSQTQQNI